MTKKEALRSLRRLLLELYASEEEAITVADQSGIDITQVSGRDSLDNYWWNLLVEADRHDKVEDMVKHAAWEHVERADELRAAYEAYENAPDAGDDIQPLGVRPEAVDVDTGGGAYVGGNLRVGGDFVGRDHIQYGNQVGGDQITAGDISGTGIVLGRNSQVQVQQGLGGHAQPSPPVTPDVSVSLLTGMLPTAYCRYLDANTFPLVTVTLDNTGQGCTNTTIRGTAVVEDASDPAVATLRIAQGELEQIRLLPSLKAAVMADLNTIRPATLHVTVEQTEPLSRVLYDETHRIHLQARDVALLAVRAPDGSIVDLTRYLAAWVTPQHPQVEQMLRRAAERHPEQRLVGYQAASPAQAMLSVQEQARAIYNALRHDADLTYVTSALSLVAEADQIAQRVRLPGDSLSAGGSANCIDGSVLFASLLELASIEPVVVVVPGHAFVGWRVWRGAAQYEFLETTLIGSAEFDEARRKAKVQYEDVVGKGYLTRGVFDPGGFARLIEVADCREQGIHPLE